VSELSGCDGVLGRFGGARLSHEIDSQGNRAVWIGGREAQVVAWSRDRVVVLLPAGAASNEVGIFDGRKKIAQGTLAGALPRAAVAGPGPVSRAE
jgi:hypothetical protein